MVIAGAGGHAKEIFGIFAENNKSENIYFYDDVPSPTQELLFGKFEVIKTETKLKNLFAIDNAFVIGIGNPKQRKLFADKLEKLGGKLESIISHNAFIGEFDVILGEGLNVFHGAVISQSVKIGKGSIIHFNSTIHHDSTIGNYCEISPNCNILGAVQIGDYCSIGAGSIVLPKIKIGENSVIGAGSVVTKDVPSNTIVKGVPAK